LDSPVSGTLDPATGGLSGDALAPGVYSFAVRLTDSLGAFIDDSYTVTINDPPKITTASLPEWTTGRPYQVLIEGIDGTQPNIWTVSSGSMPIGGTLDPAAGSLSGDARDPDDYLFTVRLSDATGAVAEKAYKVKINEWPSITSPPESVSICNRPFECGLVVADGTAPLTWSVAEGELPAGFALDPATGLISGTTTEASGYEFKLRVTDHAGAVAEKGYTVDAVPLADLAGRKHVEDIEGNIFDRPTPVCTALELVEGTKLNVSVKLRGSGSLPLVLKLLDAAGNHMSMGTALRVKSKSLVLKGLLVPATGRYYLVLEKTSSFTAGVRVTIKVTAPRKASGFDAVTPGGTFDVTCGTLKGARVSIKVKAAKGSPALPTILSVRNEAGDELLEPAELKLKKNSAVLNMKAPVAGGDLTIRIGARDGTGGEIVWSAKIREPKGYVYSRPGETAGFQR